VAGEGGHTFIDGLHTKGRGDILSKDERST